ncbi:hypothetical protein Pelo_18839 [Pelomyxa schiedti]|nr:hypothetical protein Pelo_18839 [Pelomyxa schiedti]
MPTFMDETGAFFIDRDGALFAPILNFMRTGKLFVPPSVNPDAVYNEAEYYQIPLPERPPTQPQRQQQPPAVIHDYFALRVVNNSEWRNREFVRDINVDIEIEPTDSGLTEFLYSMPLKELGTQGTPKW